jgi:hypothetical protein
MAVPAAVLKAMEREFIRIDNLQLIGSGACRSRRMNNKINLVVPESRLRDEMDRADALIRNQELNIQKEPGSGGGRPQEAPQGQEQDPRRSRQRARWRQ